VKLRRQKPPHPPSPSRPRSLPRPSLRRRVLRRPRRSTVVVGVVLLAFVLTSVALPALGWLRQGNDLAAAQGQLVGERSANDELETRVADLGSDDYISAEARGKYFYAAPGDESYTITAQSAPLVSLPSVWPFDRIKAPIQKSIERRFSQLTPIPTGDNTGR